jgi:DNA-binding MarR family transcriptional regulator
MTEHLKLSNQICHRFYKITNAITRAYRPLLKQLDITYPQYLVMMALWEMDDLEVGEIRSLTQIDGGALSLILKKLEDKSLVDLEPSENDKRVKVVTLTERGKDMQVQAASVPEQLLCQLKDCDHNQLNDLKFMLDKVLAQLPDNE